MIHRLKKTEREDGKFKIRAKFDGKCAACLEKTPEGSWVFYLPEAKKVWHIGCADQPAKGRVGYSKNSKAVQHSGGPRGRKARG